MQNYREMIVYCKFMPKDRIKEMLVDLRMFWRSWALEGYQPSLEI
jgi:hypothetical protein